MSQTDESMEITIDGKTYEVGDLTLGEIEQLEEAFDLPIAEIDLSRAKAVRYLVYFAKHRENPKFTFEDAGNIALTSLMPPAEEPAQNGAKKRPTRAAKASG